MFQKSLTVKDKDDILLLEKKRFQKVKEASLWKSLLRTKLLWD